jgi:hypothetical protein
MTPTALVAIWRDELFVVEDKTPGHEFGGLSVGALAPDGCGGALATVDGHSLRRCAPDRVCSTIATTELDLACCVAVGDVIYVGTDDARLSSRTVAAIVDDKSRRSKTGPLLHRVRPAPTTRRSSIFLKRTFFQLASTIRSEDGTQMVD